MSIFPTSLPIHTFYSDSAVYCRRLVILTAALSLCVSVQAALPASIQLALDKAALAPNNISIIISPVGDKNASRLPPIVVVIDNAKSADGIDSIDKVANSQLLTATNNPNSSSRLNTVDSPVKTSHSNSSTPSNSTKSNATKNSSQDKSAPASITLDKQAIEQQQRALNSYTNDPYIYQSLESTAPALPSINPSKPSINNNSEASKTTSNYSNLATAANIATAANPVRAPLLSHNPTSARTPASTMKLIPTFIALDTLGADFVWFTRVYHSGILIGNRLYGDLIIQGSGDPKMTHERLEQLLYRVKKSGIDHIQGDIIIDSSIFAKVSKNPAAFDNAPLQPYNASPDGFLVNFNSISINSHLPNNGQAQLTYVPQLANYQLPPLISTRASRCSNADYSLAPQWHSDKLTFNTQLPESCGEHIFYVAYPDAKDFATRVVAAKWQALGNTLSGKVLNQEIPYNAINTASASKPPLAINNKQPYRQHASLPLSPLPIVSYASLNLTQQIYDINHFSNNVMTEQVALSIGSYDQSVNTLKAAVSSTTSEQATVNKGVDSSTSLYQFDKPKTSDYPQALATINQWWLSHLQTPPPYLTNGSGLCRDCTVTAANLSELLTYAYSHPSFNAYVDSLGVAGVSGTISHHSERLPDSAAIGRAWIKTGTLNNVTSMAGYVKGQSGQDYTVVGLINTEQAINADNARPVLDAMLDWTAQQ